MKRAPSLAEKVRIVKKLSDHPMFEDIDRQYWEMRTAKDQLKKRFEQSKSVNTIQSKSASRKGTLAIEDNFSQIKPGQEVQFIDQWSVMKDEIEELKKVFFEFLQRCVENDGSKSTMNAPVIYNRKQVGVTPFKLLKSSSLQHDLQNRKQNGFVIKESKTSIRPTFIKPSDNYKEYMPLSKEDYKAKDASNSAVKTIRNQSMMPSLEVLKKINLQYSKTQITTKVAEEEFKPYYQAINEEKADERSERDYSD